MKEFAQVGDVKFQFNPSQMSFARENKYVEHGIAGMDGQPMDFAHGSGWKSVLEILLDNYTYQGRKGVDRSAGPPASYVEMQRGVLEGYSKKDPETGAPPVVMFQYGSRIFPCVITTYEEISILRNEYADITRAIIKIGIQEWVEEEYSRTTREEKGEQIYEVRGSNPPVGAETFRNIAWRIFGDPDLWKAISDFNPEIMLQCKGPAIPAGTVLRIPPWEFVKIYQNPEQQIGLVEFN